MVFKSELSRTFSQGRGERVWPRRWYPPPFEVEGAQRLPPEKSRISIENCVLSPNAMYLCAFTANFEKKWKCERNGTSSQVEERNGSRPAAAERAVQGLLTRAELATLRRSGAELGLQRLVALCDQARGVLGANTGYGE